MDISKIVKATERESQLRSAIRLYGRNNALFLALREFRKRNYKGLKDAIKNIKAIDPGAVVSSPNMSLWYKKFGMLITDNRLFRDFMDAVGIDAEKVKFDDQALMKSKSDKKARVRQKEKNDRLKEEMETAKIILSEMNQENITEARKWELTGKSKKQVAKINKAVQEGGLVKVDGVTELYNINGKLLARGKEIIFDNISKIDVKHFSELKALSDILDTAFKQNRLIDGKSTDNVAVGVHDIYDKIIANANNERENGDRNIKSPKSPEE